MQTIIMEFVFFDYWSWDLVLNGCGLGVARKICCSLPSTITPKNHVLLLWLVTHEFSIGLVA